MSEGIPTYLMYLIVALVLAGLILIVYNVRTSFVLSRNARRVNGGLKKYVRRST